MRIYEIGDLPRNDVPAAVRTYKAMVRAGTWQPYYAETLVMLQDDPERLIEALDRADEEMEK